MSFILDEPLLQLIKLRKIKTARFATETQRQNTCDSLNYSHLAQFMTQAGLTFLEFFITTHVNSMKHCFLFVFHVCLFLMQFCQMFFMNTCEDRAWYRTFMLSDMEKNRYSIHLWSYAVYIVCYVLCFISAGVM